RRRIVHRETSARPRAVYGVGQRPRYTHRDDSVVDLWGQGSGHGPTIQALLAVSHGPAPSGLVPIAHDSTGSHGPSACRDQYHRGHHSRIALWRVGSFLLSLGEKVRVRESATLVKRPLSGS